LSLLAPPPVTTTSYSRPTLRSRLLDKTDVLN
jgi:hypothetical protein